MPEDERLALQRSFYALVAEGRALLDERRRHRAAGTPAPAALAEKIARVNQRKAELLARLRA